jgi:rhodanese-related sulfurtransferase
MRISILVRHLYRNIMLVTFAIIFLVTNTLYSADNKSNQTIAQTVSRKTFGNYCGLNCLYTIERMAGKKVEFIELIKPEYIGSSKGSSLADLKNAAEDNLLSAEPVGNLTSTVLRLCQYPVILHVKSDVTSKEYNHYILFLGMENGQAKIFDPPNPVNLVSFAEIAPLWDGNGLIVSTKPIDLSIVFAPARYRFIIYSFIVIAMILALHFAKRFVPATIFNTRLKRIGLSLGQTAGFVITAVFIGFVYHFVNDEGFLARANATSSIQEAHQGNFIPKISEAKVEQLLATDTIFIDARLARDFKAGHLDGALSVPVDSNDVYRNQVTANIAKDAKIVLYCQSSGCQFAEKVAENLISDGFTNISIYKGGWMDWSAKNSKKKESI